MATVKKMKKAQSGEKVKGTVTGSVPAITKNYSVDTTGYAAGKKKFPATIKGTTGKKNKKEFETEGEASRGMVKDFIKGKTIYLPERQKYGGKVGSKKTTSTMKKGGKVKKSK